MRVPTYDNMPHGRRAAPALRSRQGRISRAWAARASCHRTRKALFRRGHRNRFCGRRVRGNAPANARVAFPCSDAARWVGSMASAWRRRAERTYSRVSPHKKKPSRCVGEGFFLCGKTAIYCSFYAGDRSPPAGVARPAGCRSVGGLPAGLLAAGGGRLSSRRSPRRNRSVSARWTREKQLGNDRAK